MQTVPIMYFEILKTEEFTDWIDEQSLYFQTQFAERLKRVTLYDHFGDHKYLNDDLWELRWSKKRY